VVCIVMFIEAVRLVISVRENKVRFGNTICLANYFQSVNSVFYIILTYFHIKYKIFHKLLIF